MVKSYEQFERPYRRGLILGLSLAELFLILLFLLILTTMGITSLLDSESNDKKEAQERAAELTDQLETIYEAVGNEIKPDDFTQLVKLASESKGLQKEVKSLKDQLSETQKELKSFEYLKQVIEVNNLEVEDVTNLIGNNKEMAEVLKEIENLEKQLTEADIEVGDLQERIEQAEDASSEYLEALSNLSERGQDPPCWFVSVPDDLTPGETRQKHIKIYDVRITDDAFEVRRHDNSNVALEIEKGNEAARPKISKEYLGNKLSETIFANQFRVLNDAGKNKRIQDYSCRFMVDVYDETSSGNKDGYKRKLSILENIFYKYSETGSW